MSSPPPQPPRSDGAPQGSDPSGPQLHGSPAPQLHGSPAPQFQGSPAPQYGMPPQSSQPGQTARPDLSTALLRTKSPLWVRITHGSIALLALLTILSLFLPLGSISIFGIERSFSLFEGGLSSDGTVLLIMLLALAPFPIAAAIINRYWARGCSSCCAAQAAGAGMLLMLYYLVQLADSGLVSIGPAPFVIGLLLGLILLLALASFVPVEMWRRTDHEKDRRS